MLDDQEIEELDSTLNPGPGFAEFLKHLRDKVLPAEEWEMWMKHVPREDYDANGRFHNLLRRLPRDKWVNQLLGTFWEREFCSLVSSWGYYSLWGQKHILYGPFRAGRTQVLATHELQVTDSADYIGLPDMFILNDQWMGFCGVKHKMPRDRYPDIGIPPDDWENHRRMANVYPRIPVLFVVHNYGPTAAEWENKWMSTWGMERFSRRKWDVTNRPEDWLAVELAAVEHSDRDDCGTYYVALEDFRPLEEVLHQMTTRANKSRTRLRTRRNRHV